MTTKTPSTDTKSAGAEPATVELAVIILNYRTAKLTCACLDSIAGEEAPGMRVVVVDNASGDGSAEAISRHIEERGFGSWCSLVRSPINGGFAAGNNLGIRSVSAAAYVLLNSDTLVRPGALTELRRVLRERPEVGLIGPSFQDLQGHPLESCHDLPHPVGELVRSANTGLVANALRRYAPRPRHSDLPLEPDWMPFACIAVRREVLDAVGMLDEGYFMYFEDVDYCMRVREAGWKLLYWPRARIVHLVGQSTQVTTTDARFRRAPSYYYEARTRFFAKHFGLGGLLLANVSWLAGRTVSRARQVVQREHRAVRPRESRDIWTNALHPFRVSDQRFALAPFPSRQEEMQP